MKSIFLLSLNFPHMLSLCVGNLLIKQHVAKCQLNVSHLSMTPANLLSCISHHNSPLTGDSHHTLHTAFLKKAKLSPKFCLFLIVPLHSTHTAFKTQFGPHFRGSLAIRCLRQALSFVFPLPAAHYLLELSCLLISPFSPSRF